MGLAIVDEVMNRRFNGMMDTVADTVSPFITSFTSPAFVIPSLRGHRPSHVTPHLHPHRAFRK